MEYKVLKIEFPRGHAYTGRLACSVQGHNMGEQTLNEARQRAIVQYFFGIL